MDEFPHTTFAQVQASYPYADYNAVLGKLLLQLAEERHITLPQHSVDKAPELGAYSTKELTRTKPASFTIPRLLATANLLGFESIDALAESAAFTYKHYAHDAQQINRLRAQESLESTTPAGGNYQNIVLPKNPIKSAKESDAAIKNEAKAQFIRELCGRILTIAEEHGVSIPQTPEEASALYYIGYDLATLQQGPEKPSKRDFGHTLRLLYPEGHMTLNYFCQQEFGRKYDEIMRDFAPQNKRQ